MTEFETVSSNREHVRLRHFDGHEFEFGFHRPDGSEWQEPHLVSHSEGGGCMGTGLAGLHLEHARTWAAAIHAGEASRAR